MAHRSSKPAAPASPPSGAALAALVQDVMAGWRAAQALKAPGRPRAVKPGTRRTAAPKPKGTARRPASDPAPALAAASAPSGRLQALGWFLAAAVILAAPRDRAVFDWPFLRPRPRVLTPSQEVAAADAEEPGRGRSARNPGEIPLRGWRDILWRAWGDFNHDNIPQVAGGVAFFGLLAVFPAMAAFVSLYGLFFDPGDMQHHLALLAGVLPAEALGLVGDQLTRLTQTRSSGLGLAFALSLLVSLWSANAGMKAMIVGLNVAFDEREKRNLVKLNLVSLAFTLAGLAFSLLAVAAIVAAPVVLAYTGYKGVGLAALRWPGLLLVAIAALSALYRYGPSRRRERWKWVTWGSVLAALLWLGASLLFSVYVAHFGSYNRTYGSLGAAVGFMSWIWVSSITVLFGAEINSEIEHQTAVDTTTGPPAVMGERGAYMADTLGRARSRRGVTRRPPASNVAPATKESQDPR
jgi:membrane protein